MTAKDKAVRKHIILLRKALRIAKVALDETLPNDCYAIEFVNEALAYRSSKL